MENLTYDDFISNILNTRGRFACGDEYHERHHIVPKCCGGTNDEENLIDLFAREHFIAHKLLAMENAENNSLAYAWWMMAHSGRVQITEDEYEESKKNIAKIQSNIMQARNLIGEKNPNYGNHKLAGENNPFYGKSHSEEIKKKLSELAKGKSSFMKGKHFSGEALEHIKEARKKKCKPVLQFNTLGEFLNRFESAEEAASAVQGSRNVISGCCKGRTSTAYGYIWIYEEDYDVASPIYKKSRKQRDPKTYFSKTILQYTIDNILVKEYISSAEASRQTNINICCIRDCCKGKQKTAGGFIWRYKNNESNQ